MSRPLRFTIVFVLRCAADHIERRPAWQPGHRGRAERSRTICRRVATGMDGGTRSRREDQPGRLHRPVRLHSRRPRISAGDVPQPGRRRAGSIQYTQGGYEASYGRYDVDERTQTWTLHVEGAHRSQSGRQTEASFPSSGNQLIVTPSSPNEHWRVAWERY